ncbi:MAG TPA: sigma-70 family RNA polymerase sigma factor [Acidimicrobiales bacterium]|jgi:RNA polymerase sigma-70 factor (ECF subfamily)|nr:sigma-70 family RNA polymerase sigma factor [Acidimicrobiales bacterium]
MTRAEVQAAVADAHRREWAALLAATVRTTRNLDTAEECVQEAFAAALATWGRTGVPAQPGAWLTTAARRRAIDAVRRDAALRPKLPLLVIADEAATPEGTDDTSPFGGQEDDVLHDERLRLIFMSCHPALASEAQLALTLRLVCGVPTTDVARALLVTDATMSARLTRAKHKIAVARIPVRVPSAAELPDRLAAVLGVVHLLFSLGYAAPSGDALQRVDLVDEAVRLARLLRELMPDEREVGGLLALLLATDARRATRVDPDGVPVSLDRQDRSRWDRTMRREAHELIVAGLPGARPGRYVLQAAIASLHAAAPTYADTDWGQIVRLYDELLVVWPSPVVRLNRAVALSMTEGPAVALGEVDAVASDGRLAAYHYLPAVRADLLRRLGRTGEADDADRLALLLAGNEAERALLSARLGATAKTSTA